MRTHRLLLTLTPLLILCLCAAPAPAEEVIEAWRSPFGAPGSVSVNSSDGSCWVACASGVWHVAADGTILSETEGFAWPPSGPGQVCVNSTDGSCWLIDDQLALVHLSETGGELWRREADFAPPVAPRLHPSHLRVSTRGSLAMMANA